ncbi:unnamed protein product, partial [marine sediment metagenome]
MTAKCSNSISWLGLHYFEQSIAKIVECKWAGHGHELHKHGENLNQTISRVMPEADWVIVNWSMVRALKNDIIFPKKRAYKIAMITSDIHKGPKNTVKGWNAGKWDAFLMIASKTKAAPEYYINNLNAPIFILGHTINPEFFKPLDQPKKYDVSLLGHLGGFYILRRIMMKELPDLAKQNNWKLLMRGRPGGSISGALKTGRIVGYKYAEAIALSKIFISCEIRTRGAVKKYFEGMACRTCVLANTPIMAEDFHFRPDWNFVEIGRDNWKEKLKYYLKHD